MRTILICLGLMVLTAAIEHAMGRLAFCKCGVISPWSGDIWGDQNSQQLADPYSFTHVIHGVLYYVFLWLVAGKRLSIATHLPLAVLIEAGWEIIENSPLIIDRYRTVTISLGYYGDSIFNSLGDIVFMAAGFLLAWRLPVRWTVIGVVATELVLLWWIRDNLTLNIIMLIHPVEAIKNWQLVH